MADVLKFAKKFAIPLDIAAALFAASEEASFGDGLARVGTFATASFLAYGIVGGIAATVTAPAWAVVGGTIAVAWAIEHGIDTMRLNQIRNPLRKKLRDQIERLENGILEREEQINKGTYWDNERSGFSEICACK